MKSRKTETFTRPDILSCWYRDRYRDQKSLGTKVLAPRPPISAMNPRLHLPADLTLPPLGVLAEHLATVHVPGAPPLAACAVCAFITATQGGLKKHMYHVHTGPGGAHACTHCGYMAGEQGKVDRHVARNHTNLQ